MAAAFAALEREEKARFLARVIHEATIDARNAYSAYRDKSNHAGRTLQDINEFVHRVSGCIGDGLAENTDAEWGESVMAMIEDYFREHPRAHLLADWLKSPN